MSLSPPKQPKVPKNMTKQPSAWSNMTKWARVSNDNTNQSVAQGSGSISEPDRGEEIQRSIGVRHTPLRTWTGPVEPFFPSAPNHRPYPSSNPLDCKPGWTTPSTQITRANTISNPDPLHRRPPRRRQDHRTILHR